VRNRGLHAVAQLTPQVGQGAAQVVLHRVVQRLLLAEAVEQQGDHRGKHHDGDDQ